MFFESWTFQVVKSFWNHLKTKSTKGSWKCCNLWWGKEIEYENNCGSDAWSEVSTAKAKAEKDNSELSCYPWFSFLKTGAPYLLHPISLLACVLSKQNSLKDTFPFTLFHLFVQGWTQVRCLFNAMLLELISDIKFPSSWLGSSWPWGPPTLECLRSCTDCGELRSVRGLGGSRVWVGPPVSKPLPHGVFGHQKFKRPKK